MGVKGPSRSLHGPIPEDCGPFGDYQPLATRPFFCTPREYSERMVHWQVRVGGISLLYVSPERFNNERFLSALKGVEVALFVVDEAHCISEVRVYV